MFQVGQKVLCVNDRPRNGMPLYGLTAGEIYTIRELRQGRCPKTGTTNVGVIVEELDHWPNPFWHDRFRPLHDKALDVFREALKVSTNETI